MNIEIKKNASETIVVVAGRLDVITAPVLEQTLNEAVVEATNLVFDLKELEYISSAGLRVLLSTQKKLLKSGSMKLTNVCEAVMEILEMTGFADILVIE